MGTDKAAMRWDDSTLLDHVATSVEAAAGSVTVIGREHPRWPSLPDLLPDAGPIGGLASALNSTPATWSLIVACDMPGLNGQWLRNLLDAAAGDLTVPRTPDGRLHPLCAVWNIHAGAAVIEAAHAGTRKVRDLFNVLDWHYVDLPDAAERLINLNTPDDLVRWQSVGGR